MLRTEQAVPSAESSDKLVRRSLVSLNHRRMTNSGRALMWWCTGTRKLLNIKLCHC